ncbi:MAG: carbon-nitrogen hydrolase family protein [Bacillus sp. (in: firmicutes)]
MKVSIAQVSSGIDKTENVQKAIKYIADAKMKGADIVVFPEMYISAIKPSAGIFPATVAEAIDGPFVAALATAAANHAIYVVCGIYEKSEEDTQRAYNTTVFINRNGEIIHTYRKTHLYDAFTYKESDTIIPGENKYRIVETEFGKIGIMVCYELRFPEIARQLALQGADYIIVPAGWFTGVVKEEHWEILIRARAIENTVFIMAANQVGHVYSGKSMIVDPMGVMMASAGEEETLLYTELDHSRIQRVRDKLPSVSHRREELYTI